MSVTLYGHHRFSLCQAHCNYKLRCITDLRRISRVDFSSNLKHTRTTRFKNNRASQTTGFHKDYNAKGAVNAALHVIAQKMKGEKKTQEH